MNSNEHRNTFLANNAENGTRVPAAGVDRVSPMQRWSRRGFVAGIEVLAHCGRIGLRGRTGRGCIKALAAHGEV